MVVEEYDAYIIVSFVNATLVLSIGETVEEVTDSGFLGTTPTLSCSQLGDDALVQVTLDTCALVHATYVRLAGKFVDFNCIETTIIQCVHELILDLPRRNPTYSR